ncbi:MAG: hypothetical protein H0V88_06655 [Pyrinomonadaceae bacterium]|nr:hypothetical protein [Pyrinomonadaceae bacterium]
MSAVWRFFKHYGLLGLWLVVAAMICSSYFGDKHDPGYYFASNTREAFYALLVISLVEVAVLYLVLRPWNYQRSLARPLLALLLFAPWALLNMMLSMHAQTIMLQHSFWLFFIVCPLLIILFLVSSIAAIVNRRRAANESET